MTNNRKLVPVEQAVELLNRRAASYNVVTISRIKGYLREEILRQALDVAQGRHSRLNSRIVGSLDHLAFETEGTQKIPLRVVNTFHSEQWQEVVHEEMNAKLDSSKVLLRTTLIRIANEMNTSYLLTTVHHAITDALSSIQLHSELLTYCQCLASSEQIPQAPSLPGLPPIDELLPRSMKGFRGTLSSVGFLLRLTFQQLSNPPQTLGFEKYVPVECRRCGMVHRQLDEALTQKFLNSCRREKTTIQGALCAAMLLAAAKKITAVKKTDIRVSCQSFVNLRQRLKPIVNNEEMGLLASFLTSFHSLRKNTLFWELARDVKHQLDAGLKCSDIFIPLLLFKTMIESLLAQPDEVPVTVALTNVGRVNIPKIYGSFELDEISFVPAQAVFGGVFGGAVATFEGKMILNFVFSEPSISRETMETLADSVMSCISDVCDRSDLPRPEKLTTTKSPS